MKCQILYYNKNKIKVISSSSAESAHSMVSVKVKVFNDYANNEHSSTCIFFQS